MLIFERLRVVVFPLPAVSVGLYGPALVLGATVILSAGLIILARGLRGESPIIGDSKIGRIALFMWGLQPLGLMIAWATQKFSPHGPIESVALASLPGLWSCLCAAGALIGAFEVARARVLLGYARYCLGVPALACAIVGVVVFSATIAQLQIDLSAALVVQDAAYLAAGIAIFVFGRAEGIRYRASRVYRDW